MYRYLVFAGCNYYPFGGMDDCKGKFNSFGEAVAFLIEFNYDRWYHIYDVQNDVVINRDDIKK